MTNVRFLNGLNTIGGNIVEITTATSRIITDFGIAVNSDDADPDTLMANHLLPDLPELFTRSAEPSPYRHEAIFISHLHLDHTAALQYLKTDIPVYLSADSYRLYKHLAAAGLAKPMGLNFHSFHYDTPVQIGDLTVTGFASDHDAFGATALLISDGRHSFGISGDVRLNGPHIENVHHWLDVFHQAHLDLFMLEATSFSFPPSEQEPASEAQLQASFRELIQTHPELLVLNPYPRNLERLLRFNQTANALNRPVVWELAYARLLHAFYPEALIHVLNTTHLNREDLNTLIPVSSATLRHEPDHFCLQNSFENLPQLDSFGPLLYLHSNGEPLGDYDPRFAVLQDFLSTHHWQLQTLSSSGHATPNALVAIAKRVNGQTTVLWHSFHPAAAAEALASLPTETRLPERNQSYHF
ncbi:MBL fold metallo-hydrolase [Furfurilactobacillus sp. WILCCON 0119]